jgi:photosystem II stability/assembly factor-like uncharacterized protein
MKVRSGLALISLLLIAGCSAPGQAVVSSSSVAAVPVSGAVQTSAPLPPALQWIQMEDPQSGWAITADRQRLVHTRDAGLTWTDVTPPVEAVRSQTSFFLDGAAAFIQGVDDSGSQAAGMLYATHDGGGSWNSFPLPFAGGVLEFADAANGWAVVVPPGSWSGPVTPALVYQTTNGGKNWVPMSLVDPQGALPAGLPPGSVQLANGATIVVHSANSLWLGGGQVASNQGIVLWGSQDNGQTWKKRTIEPPVDSETPVTQMKINLPVFLGEKQAYFWASFVLNAEGGGNPRNVMALYTSGDGGATWDLQPGLVNGVLPGDRVVMISPAEGFVHCGNAVCKTTDGGRSWSVVASNTTFSADQGRALSQLDFVSSTLGWALTDAGLYRTTDGGNIWNSVNPKFK